MRARNAAGAGAASAERRATASATAQVPGKPTLSVSPRDGAVWLAWTSGGDGGSPILRFEVNVDGSASPFSIADSAPGGANASSHEFSSGLVAGTAYTFTVRAVNGAGDGPWSDGSGRR